MVISPRFKLFCVYLISAILTNIPNLAMAESIQHSAMIPTSDVVSELTQAEAKTKIAEFLKRDDVRKQLVANGVSLEEASTRLASLSPAEMQRLAGQMDQARAGGDILFTILIIVLIIFLIQRI